MPILSIEPGYTYSDNTGSYATSLGKSSISAPLYDVSRRFTLTTSSLVALPNESCQYVSIINNTGFFVTASVNNTISGSIFIPSGTGYVFNVLNTSYLSFAGTGSIGYVVTK